MQKSVVIPELIVRKMNVWSVNIEAVAMEKNTKKKIMI